MATLMAALPVVARGVADLYLPVAPVAYQVILEPGTGGREGGASCPRD